jgi:hypothetical protein
MTVIENLDLEIELAAWDAFGEMGGVQKIRPRRDGNMPVGSQRARHRGARRTPTAGRQRYIDPRFGVR